jgi:superfamily II DNA or RNA helicase
MAADAARTEQAGALAASLARQGPTIVWSHRVEHCRAIAAALTARGIRAGLMLGGAESAEEFDRTKAGLRDGSVQAGVGTYAAIGVGQDFPEVASGVCATPMHKSRQVVRQVAGRLCRTAPGKLGATLYVLWDRAVFGLEPAKNLRRWYGAVEVQDGERWVPARHYLERVKREAQRGTDDPFSDAGAERG